jgi:hypothetical protein
MMRKRLIALIFSVVAVLIAPVAHAMGSGNPYENVQVGVTYTVYQPSFTAGLWQQHVGSNLYCAQGVEQNLLAAFGKRSGRSFTITEGNPMCSDIGVGKPVLRANINGAPATVFAYCDPASSKRCTTADVIKSGGHLAVTLPGANGLRPTQVWIETIGAKHLSAQQLVRIARGLEPVGAK